MAESQITQKQSSQKLRGNRRVRQGLVVSDKRDKTIKVQVTYLAKHKRYGKYLRKRTVLHAHDANNEANTGDLVEVMESRPVSKSKQWRLVRIIKRSPRAQVSSGKQ